jgi:hypothetical protein
MRARFITGLAALLLVAQLAGCGGKPFNVKTQPDAATLPGAGSGARAESGGVSIEAGAILDEDFLFETFDANLILAGVLPVRLKLTNPGSDPVDMSRAKFEIRAAGKSFKMLQARSAYSRLISYYGITTYSKEGYNESRDDFVSHSIDFKTPLAASESRTGLIFFAVPGDIARDVGLTLRVQRLNRKSGNSKEAVELKLN